MLTFSDIKKYLLIFINMILLTAICFSDDVDYILIPGTKVRINPPVDYYQSIDSNTFMNNYGCAIAIIEIPTSINDIINDLYIEKTSEILKNLEITKIEKIDNKNIIIESSYDIRGIIGFGYSLITGNELESVMINGAYFQITSEEEIIKLKKTIDSSKWDYSVKRDFNDLLYFETFKSDTFIIKEFLGDRLLYKFTGDRIEESDIVNMHIGSFFHNRNISKDEYYNAAGSFSFRPPFQMNYTLLSHEHKEIRVNNLEGIELTFVCRTSNGKEMTGLNYILFRPNRIYFLRSEIFSKYPNYYLDEIKKIFNSFTLNK